ncbi:hypothetical protein [Methylopila sp. 73B]|uniref:hypothetical protein n=1 Tax=Methylopila sp. 73B TaxID=1120792 RepID=UPI00037EA0D4|nr:hypothetical protein [Methylopila sp. 73B]
MSHAEFIIAFKGPAVDDGRIDVRDLAPALLSLGRSIDAANLAINGERHPVKVDVRALSAGSFEVLIDVSLSGWESVKSLLVSSDVETAKALLEWLGLLATGSASLIALYRWLAGRKPDNVVRAPGGSVTIHAGAESITVPMEVLRLYRDIAVNRALGEMLDTLKNEALDAIEFRDPHSRRAVEILTREDRPAFELPRIEDETVIDDTRQIALSIRSLAFQEGNKWRLFDGQNVITATIEDKEFTSKVDRSAIRFAKGDILICEVRSIQMQTAEGLKSEHFVRKVIEHRPAPTQIPLPLDLDGRD